MKQVKMKAEKISDGWIITEVTSTGKITKSHLASADDILLKLLGNSDLKSELESSKENASMEISFSIQKAASPMGEVHRRREELKTIEQLKAEGLIEPAEKFNPKVIKKANLAKIDGEGKIIPKEPEIVSYSAKRLKSINLSKLIEASGLKDSELAAIAGVVKVPTMSGLRRNLRLGTVTFTFASSRLYCTRLAIYFEEQSKKAKEETL